MIDLLVFRLGDTQCALPALSVSKVLDPLPVTPLPFAPESVLGLVNVSGSVILQVDFDLLFGMPTRRDQAGGSLLVVDTGSESVVCRADEISHKLSIDEAELNRYDRQTADATGRDKLIVGQFVHRGSSILLLSPAALSLQHMAPVRVPDGDGGLVGTVSDETARNDTQSLDLELVTVHDGGEAYALHMRDVLEIIDLAPLTELPGATAEVAGLMLIRGNALLVVSLARLLDCQPRGPAQFVIVAALSELRIGIAVESVVGIERYMKSQVQAVTNADAQLEGYVPGSGSRQSRMTGLISMSGLISDDRMARFRRYLAAHTIAEDSMARQANQGVRRMLTFRLGDERCALALSHVDRVEDYVEPVEVPKGDDMFAGVVQIKGEVAPVLDLPRALGYRSGVAGSYVVVRVDRALWALVVDKVERVVEIPERSITPVRGSRSDFIREIARLDEDLITLISLEPLARAGLPQQLEESS